ncbi:hypothetical protein C5Y96_04805 [Blastopirellula marina]|uniref:Uncharacterized protein n=1 Tax=Blastopirellula marina TaxID=124 RepID=A0A2S8G4I6_9BACT|nr:MULTISPECIES: hypothetical protein [Pirellulaceae]PQO39181.1 hypothetical protein C5Y96_04805 [Blastopirellula marina]RCS55489.1 hypothetical protein DTL36_04815 [Bremerella cremea]
MRTRSVNSLGLQLVLLACLCTLPLLGCSQSSQKERVIPLKASASMNNARSILENYAKGAPITSEADSFDAVVAGVRKDDEAAADTLDKAFKQIRENPGNRAKIAKETLKQLPAKPEPEPAPPTE